MKVNIHPLTYLFLLLSFLSGYFEYMYILLIIIFIHESGHLIFSKLININSMIIIYPFGGITIINADLNIPIYKEFISLIGGIIFQLLFFLLCYQLYINNIISYHVYNIIYNINIYLISFNFLPILPLDGGKLLNIILNKLSNYRLSNKVSIIISIIFILLFGLINKTLLAFILIIFLIKSIYLEIINLDLKYNIFLFERYKNNYNFTNIIHINNINKFKRDNYHIINNKYEKYVLNKMFDRKH